MQRLLCLCSICMRNFISIAENQRFKILKNLMIFRRHNRYWTKVMKAQYLRPFLWHSHKTSCVRCPGKGHRCEMHCVAIYKWPWAIAIFTAISVATSLAIWIYGYNHWSPTVAVLMALSMAIPIDSLSRLLKRRKSKSQFKYDVRR